MSYNNFYDNDQYWASIHIMKIGWNGCNLVENLKREPRINRVTIRGAVYDPFKIKIIMFVLEDTQVNWLHLFHSSISSVGAKYLADDLKNSNITRLILHDSEIGDDGLKCLGKVLKNSKVICLDVSNNGITIVGVKYLADALQDSCITHLTLGSTTPGYHNQVGDDGVKYLAEHLKFTNIAYLNLDVCGISNRGMKCLADNLKVTCITSLSLVKNNNIDNDAVRYLGRTLRDTQIISMDLGSIKVRRGTKLAMEEAMSQNEKRATKVRDVFQKLVAQNTQTHDLEFIISDITKDLYITECSHFIKMINDNSKVKGHIFDMIMRNHCDDYPDIIRKINEFIAMILDKFNAFIVNNVPRLVELFDCYDFVNLVKQFESMELHEIVRNLLLHRVLYYVDKNAEILHPYIYKMLHKYRMPLYNEQFESNKKENSISFYQNHQEIEGAQEIMNLLGL